MSVNGFSFSSYRLSLAATCWLPVALIQVNHAPSLLHSCTASPFSTFSPDVEICKEVFSIWLESNLSAREFQKCRFLSKGPKTSIKHLSTHAYTPAKDSQRLHIQPGGRNIRRRAALGFRARPRARVGWIASDCAVKSGVEFIRVSWRDFAFSAQLVCFDLSACLMTRCKHLWNIWSCPRIPHVCCCNVFPQTQ